MMKRFGYITPEDYDIAEANGIKRKTAYYRVHEYGWDIDRAITEKPQKRTSHGEYTRRAQENGISRMLFYHRLNQGMTPEEACTTPKMDKEEQYKRMSASRKSKYAGYLEQAVQNGLSKDNFYWRIRKGWSLEDAVKPPTPNDGSRRGSAKRKSLKNKTTNTSFNKKRPSRVFTGERNPNSKLTERDIIEIKKLLKEGVPQIRIAIMYGVSETTISQIKHRKAWKHIG